MTKGDWIFLAAAAAIGVTANFAAWTGFGIPNTATLISLLALFVSVLVFGVQFGQWRTAHLKVAVDLIERRFAVLTRAEDAIGQVIRLGEVEMVPFEEFARAQQDARFLFGPEVQKFMNRTRGDLAVIRSLRRIDDDAPNRNNLIDRKFDALLRVSAFFSEAHPLFIPYIGLQHRISPRWFAP
jgi:hypothetical protein